MSELTAYLQSTSSLVQSISLPQIITRSRMATAYVGETLQYIVYTCTMCIYCTHYTYVLLINIIFKHRHTWHAHPSHACAYIRTHSHCTTTGAANDCHCFNDFCSIQTLHSACTETLGCRTWILAHLKVLVISSTRNTSHSVNCKPLLKAKHECPK